MLPSILNNLTLPIISSPLFAISYPELVVAQCKAGIVGSFPALNAREPDTLEDWIDRINTQLAVLRKETPHAIVGPYAVNQIIHASNTRAERDIRTCIDLQVPILITSLRPPERALIDAVHEYGGLVLHDVINLRHAKKAIDAGVDGLILVAAGAGGHAGTLSPFAFVAEVRKIFDGIVVLGGAIATGESIFAARALGADLAYVGTRFIASREANAKDAYKSALVEAQAGDIIYTDAFTGVHGNYVRQSILAAGLDPDALPESAGAKIDFSATEGMQIKAWRDIWGAGQGVGSVDDVDSVSEIVARLCTEYRGARERMLG
ncbi:nitronate monooxygenase [Paraburkholderia dipogonis]|uniref:Nitronate monooxygenase n=1 Tax=Paraburkholderia dipogonis TaxID=1211383 RepID=A0A4Y8MNX6_9BURK|nr:nitronate monooxygenase family protein [Paraburkholderia dipogonis]TFE39186.1 nitronate monooxygenase [Paraburkholderia dipogonis]